MSTNSIYDAYISWLFDKVMYKEMRRSGRSYKQLLLYLHSRQFTWTLDFDANRAEDGKYLRYKFLDETGYLGEIKGACSVLEMAIALSDRINEDLFLPDPSANGAKFFWMMMENCGLDELTDDYFDEKMAENIVDIVLKRQYSSSGLGGFFPLKHPKEDQKCTELWYQMQKYIQENYSF